MSQPVGDSRDAERARPRRGSLTVSARHANVDLAAVDASTDDVGVAGYNVYLDGAAVGTTGRDDVHRSRASPARRAISSASRPSTRAGNVSAARRSSALDVALRRGSPGSSPRTRSTRAPAPSATTRSGNGHNGTISGATWADRHDGGGLSFNGSNA